MAAERQLAMVINLDKCIGCQSCTVTCRRHWMDRPGTENMYYIWCETQPGKGWPRDWMDMGRKVPHPVNEYGGTWTFNWQEVYSSPARSTHLKPTVKETGEAPEWGVLWDEDQGAGEWPNGHFFYMPRLCNHCGDTPCIDACADYCAKHGAPVAMTKRAADGIVAIDGNLCLSCGMCVASCPYKIPQRNTATSKFEMCDMCMTRVGENYAPVCAKSCPARAMSFGYLDDPESFVHKLVKTYGVAVPLRPDYGTSANVYYVPPFVRPNKIGADNELLSEPDLPDDTLRRYFGDAVDGALKTLREHRERAVAGETSELMELLIVYKWADAFRPFAIEAPSETLRG